MSETISELKCCDNCGNSRLYNNSKTWCRRIEVCGDHFVEWRPIGSKSELEIIVEEAERMCLDYKNNADYCTYNLDDIIEKFIEAIQALKKDHPEFKGE